MAGFPIGGVQNVKAPAAEPRRLAPSAGPWLADRAWQAAAEAARVATPAVVPHQILLHHPVQLPAHTANTPDMNMNTDHWRERGAKYGNGHGA